MRNYQKKIEHSKNKLNDENNMLQSDRQQWKIHVFYNKPNPTLHYFLLKVGQFCFVAKEFIWKHQNETENNWTQALKVAHSLKIMSAANCSILFVKCSFCY